MFEKPYFMADARTLAALRVQLDQRIRRVADLSPEELLGARQQLEEALETDQCLQVPGGELECRKMLRALRYAIGPNRDRCSALQWRILSILVTNVRVEIDGDRARSVCYFLNPMGLPQKDGGVNTFFCGGIYRDRLLRTERGWRITERINEQLYAYGALPAGVELPK